MAIKSEKQLQQECYMYFHNTYKHLRGRLFMTENATTKNEKGLGLVKGVSDLQYVLPDGTLCPIELKVDGSRHNVEHLRTQLEWMELVAPHCGTGYFCFNFDDFKYIMYRFSEVNTRDDLGIGLHAHSYSTRTYIRDLIRNANTKTVKLNYNFKP